MAAVGGVGGREVAVARQVPFSLPLLLSPLPGCLDVMPVLGSFSSVGCVNRTCLVAITSSLPALPITATTKWPKHHHCYQTACNDSRECENGKAPPPLCTLPTCLLALCPFACLPTHLALPSVGSPKPPLPLCALPIHSPAHHWSAQGLSPAAPRKLSLW